MRGRNLSMIAFILVCGSITYFDLKKCHRMPWPPRFIFAALAFAMMELVSAVDETLGGVTSIGFVIAVFLKEGFVSDCEHITTVATGQPQSATFIGDTTSGNPQQQPSSTSSLSEYQQQVQPAQLPGTTLA